MNTNKALFLAIALIFLLMACNKDIPKPRTDCPKPPPDPSQNVSGQFDLKNRVDYNTSNSDFIEYSVFTEGEGTVNILGPSEIILEHRKILEFEQRKEFIGDGILTIVNENGTELRGTYTNIEFFANGNYTLPVTITGGSGELVNAYGNLVVEMLSRPNEVGNFSAELRGIVYLRGRNEFPVLI